MRFPILLPTLASVACLAGPANSLTQTKFEASKAFKELGLTEMSGTTLQNTRWMCYGLPDSTGPKV